MNINPDKSHTIGLNKQIKEQKIVLDTRTTFNVGNRRLRSLASEDEWTYLGTRFDSRGRLRVKPADIVVGYLDKLSKAPMKPQQKLYTLTNYVVPKIST